MKVEYILVKFDDTNRVAQVTLKAQEVLAKLNAKELADPDGISYIIVCFVNYYYWVFL